MFKPRARKGTEGQGTPRHAAAKEGLYLRACHDCGRMTTDYRCPACLMKWRLKHGVLLRATDEEGI